MVTRKKDGIKQQRASQHDISRRVDAIHVKALCTALLKLVNHDMEQRLAQANIDINISALLPMRMLQFGPSTIQELSKQLLIAPATLIPVIDELEAKGLITRESSTTDRRVKLLHLTTKGSALFSKIHELNHDSKFITSINALSKKETITLITLLDKLVTDVSGSSDISTRILSHICKQIPQSTVKKQLRRA